MKRPASLMEARELRCPNCARVMALARMEHRYLLPTLIVYECKVCHVFINEPMDEGAEKRTLH